MTPMATTRDYIAYPESIIEFPSHRDPTQSLERALLKTGIAAAAVSDGLVGDGAISIEEWENAESLKLHNHVTPTVLTPRRSNRSPRSAMLSW